MRQIKFRVWDKDKKEMYPVWQLDFSVEPMVIVKADFDQDGYTEKHIKSFYLQQFTGLLDKNGKEIYEGDLIQAIPNGEMPHEIIEIKWNDKKGGWYLGDVFLPVDMTNVKVIGNIYENPELLNNK